MRRLLDHYRHSFALRLRLWLGSQVELEGPNDQGATLVARYRGRTVRLLFLPAECRWRLTCGEESVVGSFDRMTKRARQIFTLSPRAADSKEEADLLTRSKQDVFGGPRGLGGG